MKFFGERKTYLNKLFSRKKIVFVVSILMMFGLTYNLVLPFTVEAQGTGMGAGYQAAYQAAQQLAAEAAKDSLGGDQICWVGFRNGGLSLTGCMALVADTVLAVLNRGVAIAAKILDFAIDYSLLDMKANIDKLTGINVGWSVLRDASNILFIFILLYIAIVTILQVGNFDTKKTIRNVIVIALFINFSLFFTKVVVDASNIVALNYHDRSVGGSQLSTKMFQSIDITKIYSAAAEKTGKTTPTTKQFINIMVVAVVGGLLMLITIFVFLAAAILFILRYIVIVFLMILSPLAFMAYILPRTQEYFSDWWKKLLNNALFAPLYMILIYISFQLITQLNINGGGLGDLSNFDKIEGAVGTIVNAVTVAGFLIATLIVSKQLGARGSGTIIGWGKDLQKWGQGVVGRNTVGLAGKYAVKGFDAGVAAAKNPGQTYRNMRDNLKEVGMKGVAKRAGLGLAAGADIALTGGVGTMIGAGVYGAATKKGRERVAKAAGGVANYAGRTVREGLESVEAQKFGSGQSLKDVEKRDEVYKKAISEKEKELADKAKYREISSELEKAKAKTIPAEGDEETRRKAERERNEAIALSESKMQQFVQSLSGNEIAKNYKNATKESDFARHLSKRQLDALEKNEDINESMLKEIKKAKFGELNDAIEKGGDVKGAFKKLSDEDLEILDQSGLGLLTSDRFKNNIGTKEYAKIQSNKGISGATKQVHRNALENRVTDGTVSAETLLKNVKPKDVAELSDDILGRNDVMDRMTGQVLGALLDKGIGEDLQEKIMQRIKANKNHPARNWIKKSPRGADFGTLEDSSGDRRDDNQSSEGHDGSDYSGYSES